MSAILLFLTDPKARKHPEAMQTVYHEMQMNRNIRKDTLKSCMAGWKRGG